MSIQQRGGRTLIAGVIALALVAGACGDDDETATAGDGGDDTTEYCALIAQLDDQDGPPTSEQLTKLKEIRPEAVGADTDMVVDAFVAADGDIGAIFSDPKIEEAFGRMEAHDAEVCGTESGDDEDEDEPDTEAAEGANVVAITAVDFEFQGVPTEIPAGLTALQLTNAGDSAHEMFVAKLGEGITLDEVLALEGEPTDEQATEIGGAFGQPGGEPTYVNAELAPGTYAVVCFIPGPGGKAHHELGMKTTFTVV